MGNVHLIPMEEADIPLLETWLHREHIRRWWGDPEENLAQLRAWQGGIALIEADGYMVGCVCWSFPTRRELDEAGLTEIPTTVIDIDIMIGEFAALGKGIGPSAIRLAVARIISEHENVTAVMACSSVNNKASKKAFLKAGFRLEREFDDPVGGPFVLMWMDKAVT